MAHLAVSRRTIQCALGVAWILDGALQLQPFMFTTGFATRIILPTAAGQPGFVRDPVQWAGALILGHPALWDALFALGQLLIGAGMLVRATVRPAIAVSVAWALGVWFAGEGLGGLAGGTTTFLSGAPGAVVLYAVLGLAAWPTFDAGSKCRALGRAQRPASRIRAIVSRAPDQRPARWVPVAWAGVWGLFAVLSALPANASGAALRTQVTAAAAGAPGWLSVAQHAVASALSHAGPVAVVVMVVVEAAIGVLGVLPDRVRQGAAWTGIAVSLAVWVLGQAFGQIPTGMGTDPNSAPLVALLGIALLGRVRAGGACAEGRVPQARLGPERTL